MELLRLLNWPLKLAFWLGRWVYVTFFGERPEDRRPPEEPDPR